MVVSAAAIRQMIAAQAYWLRSKLSRLPKAAGSMQAPAAASAIKLILRKWNLVACLVDKFQALGIKPTVARNVGASITFNNSVYDTDRHK